MTEHTDPTPFDQLPFKERIRHVQINPGGPTKPRTKTETLTSGEKVEHRELLGDDTGKYAGHETHHADGTWDCTMRPDPIRSKPAILNKD